MGDSGSQMLGYSRSLHSACDELDGRRLDRRDPAAPHSVLAVPILDTTP